MFQMREYDDYAANAVLSRLDPSDLREAALVRGAGVTGLGLFGDWRAMRGAWIASRVFFSSPATGAKPFAVGALANTGQAGVAQAALLARDHAVFRRSLAALALHLRVALPEFAFAQGIHRIEARCWAEHPSAPSLLTALGFTRECVMPGFGRHGRTSFIQFAWIAPDLGSAPAPDVCLAPAQPQPAE